MYSFLTINKTMSDYEDRARQFRVELDKTERPDIRTALIMKFIKNEWEQVAKIADLCATTCAQIAVKTEGNKQEIWEAKMEEASFVAEEIRDAMNHGCCAENARQAALEKLKSSQTK